MKRTVLICLLLVFSSPAWTQSGGLYPTFIEMGGAYNLESNILGENRVLNIYLPANYHQSDTTRYPVIYLLDGSLNEDYFHVAGLIQFASAEWVKMMSPCILVGIGNVDRKRDFTFPTSIEQDRKDFPTTGGSASFIRFLEEELQPFVNNGLRTNGTEMLIGQSLGGLLATEILYKKPVLFDRYVIVSPSIWWDDQSLFEGKFTSDIKKVQDVYVAVGKEHPVMRHDARQLAKKLKRELGRERVGFDYLKHEDHASILHIAVYRALEFQKKSGAINE